MSLEEIRSQNIAKNNAFLESLGFQESKSQEKKKKLVNSKAKEAEKRKSRENDIVIPTRRSSRIAGELILDEPVLKRQRSEAQVEHGDEEDIDAFPFFDEDDGEPRNDISPESLREFIIEKNIAHLEEISDEVC